MKKKIKKVDKVPKEIEDWLDAEDNHFISYKHFLKDLLTIPSEERTLKWLDYVANDLSSFGDVEALVYLISRGYNCEDKIERLIELWKNAERKTIEHCAAGHSIVNADTGKSKTVGKRSIQEASQIKNLSVYQLRNFWGFHDQQQLSIDATMLRSVEWCKIGGFTDWWERLAKYRYEDIIQGGISPVPNSFYLFYNCRSDYSIKIMRKALERTLEALYIPEFNSEYPWLIHNDIIIDNERKYQKTVIIPYACSIVFANYKLFNFRSDDKNIIDSALETILKYQKSDGSWNCWEDEKESDIESTAMAIHALVLAKPRGWKRAVKLAKNWLLSKRTEYGNWTSSSAPDDVFLTVLVLDSINLVDSKSEITFSLTLNDDHNTVEKKRFDVALSFPGEQRALVEKVSSKLVEKLSIERGFYDKFFEAELARPNLDVYLQEIYHKQSRLIVIFLCQDYKTKEWCGLEWRAIRDLIKKRKDEDILFLILEPVEIPGLFSIDGYVDIHDKSSDEIAQIILKRLKTR